MKLNWSSSLLWHSILWVLYLKIPPQILDHLDFPLCYLLRNVYFCTWVYVPFWVHFCERFSLCLFFLTYQYLIFPFIKMLSFLHWILEFPSLLTLPICSCMPSTFSFRALSTLVIVILSPLPDISKNTCHIWVWFRCLCCLFRLFFAFWHYVEYFIENWAWCIGY